MAEELEPGIEIAVVGRIAGLDEIGGGVDEYAAARAFGIEKGKAMTDDGLGAGGNEQREMADGEPRLATAQVVEPDQPEAEEEIGFHSLRRGGDGGDPGVSFAQEGA